MIFIRGAIGTDLDFVPKDRVGGERVWSLFEGRGWRLEVRDDKVARLSLAADGLLIHDGRCDEFPGEVFRRNGSWLEFDWSGNEKIQVCSDRLGTVPIYWARRGATTYFASRLTDMVRLGFDAPDPIGVMQMVMLNQATGTRTVLRGVEILPCATRVELSAHGMRVLERYWEPQVNDEPVRNESALIEEGAAIIRRANRKALETARAGKVAWPLTGGLDSRCNSGCCADLIKDDDLFFHVEDMGDFELPIARKLGRALGKVVREFHSAEFMRQAVRADLDLDAGDFNVGHWRLMGTARELAEDHGFSVTIDGFLQGILMNPAMFFYEGTVATAREKSFSMARFRAERFGIDANDPLFTQFVDDYEATYPNGRHGLDASQKFIMENRSRRMVFGIVRLNGNYLDVRTPGMDSDFIDYAMRLPWSLRKGAVGYKKIINAINPQLAAIAHDKTGLPLTAGSRVSRQRRAAKFATYYVNRIWPGKPLIQGKETAFEKLLRTDGAFRGEAYSVIAASSWLREVFGGDMVSVFERQRTNRGLSYDGLGAMLTIGLLERYAKNG